MTGFRGQATLFDDGKEPDALRTIGEVSAALGIKQHVLRYWEQQFPSLRPLKRSGGRRYYRAADVHLVATIDRLVNREGYTLKGAKLAIAKIGAEGPESSQPAAISAPREAAVSAQDLLPQLQEIRRRLASALDE